VWEEELEEELTLLLQNVILQVDRVDCWLWHLESSHVFSVRSVYNFMTLQPPVDPTVEVSSLWHKDVPLKVVLCAWRLSRDRLPTKDNLLRRGVIDNDSRLCVSGCGFMEISSNLFLHCYHFGSVWCLIYRWIGVSMVSPLQVAHHFHLFSFLAGASKARRSFIQVIWFATMWEI